jgi:hypothetical protein
LSFVTAAREGRWYDKEGDLERAHGEVDRCGRMKSTPYFMQQVLRKRPYLREAWCEQAIREPLRREVQPNGRIRLWTYVVESDKYLRVVLLQDGVTVHNAFFDRNFNEDRQ